MIDSRLNRIAELAHELELEAQRVYADETAPLHVRALALASLAHAWVISLELRGDTDEPAPHAQRVTSCH